MKSAARPFYKSNERMHEEGPAFPLRPIAWFVMLACCDAAIAQQPSGAQVISGSASMQGVGTNHLTITNTPGAIINWQSFSIGAKHVTEFVQQSATSAVLNRVVGSPELAKLPLSQIDGILKSNGRVFLINPAGILVGAGAVIDTAGFVGSTLNMLDADFLAGKLRFQGDPTAGAIANHGFIKTTHGGSVVLVAPNVENSGIIQTDDGKILLAAGRKLTIGSLDANDVQFEVQAPADSVLNVGKLLADGGAVNVFAGTLKHSGDVRANALTRDEAGRIVLEAQGDVTLAASSRTSADGKSGGAVTVQSTSGTTIASGLISAKGSDGKGGDVRVLGERVGIFDAAVIDASGKHGGGQILIGGDFQGKNPQVQNASVTVLAPDATLRANGGQDGDGGKVIVWANDTASIYGTIHARGGTRGGNGGFIETSGKRTLNIIGARVDTSAPAGMAGAWLLDPTNLTVQAGGASPPPYTFATTGDSIVDPGALTAAGGAILLQAHNDVTFNSDLAAPNTLTVEAGRSILINANVSTANANLTMRANRDSGGSGVINAERADGAAEIRMAPGTSLSSDTAITSLTIETGAGRSGLAAATGDIVLANMTAGQLNVRHLGSTANSSIVRAADVAGTPPLITADNMFLMLDRPGGANASIGKSGSPIRVSTNAFEARTFQSVSPHTDTLARGGIFIASPNGALQIGGALGGGTISGPARGVQTIGAPIEITVNGALTRAATDSDIATGGDPAQPTPPPGPFGNVTLSAASIGTAVTPIRVEQGTASVTATAMSAVGDIFIRKPRGPMTLSQYTLSLQPGRTANLGTLVGNIIVDSDVSLAGRNLTLETPAAGIVFLRGPTASTSSTLTAAGFTTVTAGVTADSGTMTLEAPASIAGALNVTNDGTLNFNATSNAAGGGKLESGTLGGTGTLTFTGATFEWSGGSLNGTGTLATAPGAELAITGAGIHSILGGYKISSAGNIRWEAGDVNTASAGSTIAILAGGRLDKNGTGTSSLTGSGPMNVAGSLHVNDGRLRLGTGGTHTGDFNILGGAVLDFSGGTHSIDNALPRAAVTGAAGSTVVFSGGTTNVNDATFDVQGTTDATGGTVNFAAASTVTSVGALIVGAGGTMALTSGAAINATTLDLAGTLTITDPLALSGLLTWTGGTMSGAGTTDANGGIALSGAPTLGGGRVLNNAAGQTATWTGTGLTLAGNARINNAGNWQDQTAGASITGSGTFANTGTYQRNAGTSTVGAGVVFNNDNPGATVNILAGGRLNLNGGGASTRPFAVDGTLAFGADYTQTGSSISGGGTVEFAAGTVALANGTYDMTVGGAGTTRVSGGTANFTGTGPTVPGAIDISAGTLNFSSVPVAAASLNMSGGTLTGTQGVSVTGATAWSGGTMTGAVNTNANGGLTLSGGTKTLTAGRTLVNAAAQNASWTGGTIAIDDGASIVNAGNWSDQGGGGAMSHTGPGGSVFTNTGTYTKEVSAGTTVVGVPFDNTGGNVNVNLGVLRLSAGGTSTGNLAAGAGATLDFNGGTYAIDGGNVSGAGTVSFSAAGVSVNGGNYAVTGATTQSGGSATFNAGANVVSVGALTVSNGGLVLNSGETIASTSLTLSGGTLAGADTINVSGATAWSGGTMSGAGVTNANGGLTLRTGGSNKVLAGGRTLNNAAGQTATWSGAGGIQVVGTATINNFGTWDDATNGGILSAAGGSAVFNNAGAYVKSAAGTSAFNSDVTFNNNAAGSSLAVNAGALRVLGGGASTRSMSAGPSGTLEFAVGSYTFGPGATLDGTGTVLVSSGTLAVNSPITFGGTFQMSGGTIAAASPIVLGNTFAWTGGTMQGAGLLTTNGVTTVSGGVTLSDKSWTNAGTATIGGTGSVTLSGASANAVANQAGATLTVTSTSATPITAAGGAGAKSFSNAGTFNASRAAAGTSTINLATSNTGTINVTAGTLALPSFPTNAGTLNVDGTLSTGAALTNDGTVGGAGTIDLGGATLTNNATLRPGSAAGDTTGTLSIIGNLVQATSDSRINVELGGTGAGNFDVVAVSGAATITGKIDVAAVGGYTPATGDVFQVITAGSRTGNFQSVTKNFPTPMRAAYAGLATPGVRFTMGGDNIVNWVAGDGDIGVPGNWDLGHVPGAGEIARIDDPTGVRTVTSAGTFTPDSLTSSENVTITGGNVSLAQASSIAGALTMTGGVLQGAGGLTVSGPANVSGGTINVASLLALTGAGASSVDGAATTLAIAAGGVLRIAGGGSLTVGRAATFTSAGNSDIQNGSLTINAPGYGNNTGAIALGPNAALTTSAPVFVNSGSIAMGAGSTLSTGGNPMVNAMGATIGGTGTINLAPAGGGPLATLANNGAIAPGASPGAMTVIGNYTQNPAGVLNVELGGLTAGSGYDVMNITGVANLGGTLNVSSFGGFTPFFGNRFDVMTFASRVGDFGTINFPANIPMQASPGGTTYALLGLLNQRDNTADELKRITDELLRVAALDAVDEPKFSGGRQICQ